MYTNMYTCIHYMSIVIDVHAINVLYIGTYMYTLHVIDVHAINVL